MGPHASAMLDSQREESTCQPARRIDIWRFLALAALGPLVTGYAVVAALLALVAALATHSDFSTIGVLLAAGPAWLAAFQVPLDIAGHELGALPLLPTIGLLLLVARTAVEVADRLVATVHLGWVILTIAVAHGAFGAVLTMATAAGPATAAIPAGGCGPAVLAGAAATLRLAHRYPLVDRLRDRVPPVVLAGARTGLIGLVLLLTAGAAIMAFGLAVSATTATELFRQAAPGIGNGIGMLMLSVCYLPNAVLAGLAFLTGPGLSIGDFSVGPLRFLGGEVPSVPLLAALPDGEAQWWPLVFVLPAGIGVLVGWSLRACSETPWRRIAAVGIAALVAGSTSVPLGAAAGGALADGPFGPVTVHPWQLGAAVVLWLAGPGALAAWWTGVRPIRDVPVPVADDEEPVAAPSSADDETEIEPAVEVLPEDADDVKETAEDGEGQADPADSADTPAAEPPPDTPDNASESATDGQPDALTDRQET
jgi:hypothetical protein